MTNLLLSKQSSESDIKKYFESIVRLNNSSEKFPVNLNDVWMLEYVKRDKAIDSLKANFIEDIDYQTFSHNGEKGRPMQIYMLAPSCLEYFIARKNRDVFEVYRNVFHKAVKQFIIPTTLSGALMLAAKQAEQLELQQAKIQEDAPKVELHDKLMSSDVSISFDQFSKIIGIGRNTLYKMCREDKILMTNGERKNIPYQNQMDSGNFEVKEVVIDVKGQDITLIKQQTLVTPKGQSYLTNKYNPNKK